MKNIFRYRYIPQFFVKHKAEQLGALQCTNDLKREVPLIVSVTQNESDFDELQICIYSLLNQTIFPDRIVLWLSDEYKNISNLPYEITQFIKNGLEIKFVKDLGVFNKTVYALKEFPNSIVVTASDEVYYQKDWLEKLYHSYITNPDNVHVHIADKIIFNENKILTSKKWNRFFDNECCGFQYYINSDGGVLIPPNSLIKEVFREDVFMKYLPFNENLWIWMMSVLSSKKICIVKNHNKTIYCTNLLKKLRKDNNKYDLQITDKQLARLMRFYGQNIFTKLTQS